MSGPSSYQRRHSIATVAADKLNNFVSRRVNDAYFTFKSPTMTEIQSISTLPTTVSTPTLTFMSSSNCTTTTSMALSTITTTSCGSPATAPSVASTSTGAIQKQQLTAEKQKHSVVQTGMDRYITINSNKRNRSPQNNKQGNQPKINKINIETVGDMGSNRYAILGESIENPNKEKCDSKTKSSKPPPIYIRDKSSNELVKNLTKLIGENTFHIIPLTKGNIHETKLQIYAEKDYRVVQTFLTKEKKNYYTYQLKSSKGQVVVLKGTEPTVKPEEIKEALHKKGFEAKVVINIINRNKIPQPLFKVELAPATKVKTSCIP